MSSHMSTTKMTSTFPSSTPKFALWNLYPSLDLRPPEISLISHQGATFKPQHSSHGNHDSWQSSHHEFSTVKREIEKKWTTPKAGSNMQNTYPWGSLRCLKRSLQRFQDLLRCLWDVPCKKPSGWHRNVDWWCFCMFFASSLLDAQPALQLRSSLSFQALCALPPERTEPSNDPGVTVGKCHEDRRRSHHISGLPHHESLVSAERQLQLLFRRQVAVVHTDHKILDEPKTDWIWLSTGLISNKNV